MAKRFLESLVDPFEDDLLDELIPAEPKAKPVEKKKSKPAHRKKAFLEALDEAFESQVKNQGKPSLKGKKSFLSSLEDAFDDPVFEELIPRQTTRRRTTTRRTQPESRLVTNLDSQLLVKIREYAGRHGLRMKDIIEEALEIYLKKISS